MKLVFLFLVLLYSPFCSPINFLSPHFISTLVKLKLDSYIERIIQNPRCASDFKLWISSLLRGELWAISMLDASAKLNSGFLMGNIYSFGNYEQCLAINEPVGGSLIKGQYCNLFLEPLNHTFDQMVQLMGVDPVPPLVKETLFVSDVCIPHSCTSQDMNHLWDALEQVLKPRARFVFRDEYCHHEGKPVRPTAVDTFSFLFFGGIFVTVLASTAYDIYLHYTKSQKNLLVIFSLYTNSKKLLSTRLENSSLTCLYGLKFFSMLWIAFNHFLLVRAVLPNSNGIYIATEWKNRFENSIFISPQYAVETYFCIGGLLISYVQLKYSEKFKINVLSFYMHRILRLTPALLATMLLYLSVIKHVLEGPIWLLMMKKIVGNCSSRWWATVLLVSNFLPFRQQCIEQSWYLSVDTHLYLIAPLILFQIKRRFSRVVLAIVAICFFSMVYSFVMVLVHKLKAVLILDTDDKYLSYIYLSPINHAPAWLFGVLTGYLLHRQDSKIIHMTKTTNLILWAASLGTTTLLILGQTVTTRNSNNFVLSAVINSFARPLWSLAVCFMIFSCSTGHGGFVNTFLSHPLFIVLGKLTYSMFLTHLGVIDVLLAGSMRHPGYFSNFDIFCDFWGIFVVILACSTVMCLVFETPVLALMQSVARRNHAVLKKPDES
ncbi:nose resistant to fluoxetine protein 6-like [Tenebrio molitor]|uniref:nose resistant to fluoxetine protein 6-like n=1 Tax=Tenebrio molitor TaxID=7067 RepID=UPI0036248AA4